MSRKAINADYATSRQIDEEAGTRAKIYSKKLGRRLYAVDVLALPEERATKLIAFHLSNEYMVEFMELCRKALPPEGVTQRFDRTRRFPPAYRSMRELIERTEHRSLLEVVLNDFNTQHPDAYYDILERLYGVKTH